jgi:hypothetical protein
MKKIHKKKSGEFLEIEMNSSSIMRDHDQIKYGISFHRTNYTFAQQSYTIGFHLKRELSFFLI